MPLLGLPSHHIDYPLSIIGHFGVYTHAQAKVSIENFTVLIQSLQFLCFNIEADDNPSMMITPQPIYTGSRFFITETLRYLHGSRT